MPYDLAAGAGFGAGLNVRRRLVVGAVAATFYDVVCRDRSGAEKWRERFHNLVVNTGLDDILDKYFKGSAYTASHFVGLKGAGAPAATDTMASHAGWSELTPYAEAARPTLTLGAVSGQSVDNSASKAQFSINGSATIAGAFVSTDSTKGGTTGILYGAGDFASARAVENGDTLNVTVTLTQAAA